jgi:hypothetical protein
MSRKQGPREVGMRPSAIAARRRNGGIGKNHLPAKEADK